MAARRFEELIAWQKARALAGSVYRQSMEEPLSRDFGLRDQIRRAAVSVMANIAEGFDREGTAEFSRFLTIAKASCAELKSHFYIALDVGYLSDEQFQQLFAQTEEVNRLIVGIRRSLST